VLTAASGVPLDAALRKTGKERNEL
jgi:hypothetical protein